MIFGPRNRQKAYISPAEKCIFFGCLYENRFFRKAQKWSAAFRSELATSIVLHESYCMVAKNLGFVRCR